MPGDIILGIVREKKNLSFILLIILVLFQKIDVFLISSRGFVCTDKYFQLESKSYS